MNAMLDKIEQRVLGVLIEKSLSQPEYYPMTLNAVVVASNQKNNRDPVLEMGEDDAWDALERLRQRDVVHKILPGPGIRTERFKHNAEQSFHWQTRQRAVMAELLLRGPQTIAELRTRCARMTEMGTAEDVAGVLDALTRFDPPMAAPLPRATGEKAIRWTHLLDPDGAPALREVRQRPGTEAAPQQTHGDGALRLAPIGIVRSEIRAARDDGWGSVEAKVVLEERWRAGLRGIDAYSHAVIVFFMHGLGSETVPVLRRPRGRADLPETGIFAQRSRHRPNPIGVTTVEIVAVEPDGLRVRGLDAIDGTPVLDIKPYMPIFDRRDGARTPAWVDDVMRGYF